MENGCGPYVIPAWGLTSGMLPSEVSNLKCLMMFAKKRKFSILARFSPRHLLFPIPKGMFLSSALYFPSTVMNLSGLSG